jgi:hypothetical protein
MCRSILFTGYLDVHLTDGEITDTIFSRTCSKVLDHEPHPSSFAGERLRFACVS